MKKAVDLEFSIAIVDIEDLLYTTLLQVDRLGQLHLIRLEKAKDHHRIMLEEFLVDHQRKI
ncbi:hypothetical protein DERP_001654 [Dermatophagoides pteronyssinus]|uniref:Uncharacterized protein n=1 Tax=Dermatophagoides pteronyssinus TaxID=6956 RepID=A0ABQ8JBQ1_DERPT|nr:hypothetical protein DERP_001654 [Dermatophagoides pteronyssinus]